MHLCRNKLNPYDKQETFLGEALDCPPLKHTNDLP